MLVLERACALSSGQVPSASVAKTDKNTEAIDEALDEGIDGDSLEEAIAKLTPEQAEMFMRALTLTMHKRRLMVIGNLLALLFMIFGFIAAVVIYAQREPGTFMGWIFLIPFAAGAASLWFFGGRAKRAGAAQEDPLPSASAIITNDQDSQ